MKILTSRRGETQPPPPSGGATELRAHVVDVIAAHFVATGHTTLAAAARLSIGDKQVGGGCIAKR
jgi:hypothetical protein